MKKINDYFKASNELSREVRKSFRSLGYKNDEEFQNMDINSLTPEEMLIYTELRKAFEKLEDYNYIMDYLSLPIKYEGIIHKNANGRYELDNGFEYTSGNRIEALIYDDFLDCLSWVKTSVESNEDGYYLVGHRHVSMDGIKVRIR